MGTPYLQGYLTVGSISAYKRAVATLNELGYITLAGRDSDELIAYRTLEKGDVYLHFSSNGHYYVFQQHSVVKHGVKWKLKELVKAHKRAMKGCECRLYKGTTGKRIKS